jgi:hypothetical protein
MRLSWCPQSFAHCGEPCVRIYITQTGIARFIETGNMNFLFSLRSSCITYYADIRLGLLQDHFYVLLQKP